METPQVPWLASDPEMASGLMVPGSNVTGEVGLLNELRLGRLGDVITTSTNDRNPEKMMVGKVNYPFLWPKYSE